MSITASISDLIFDLFNNFDISYTEDELLHRGVSQNETTRLTTSNSNALRDYLASKKWDVKEFWTAVLQRSQRKFEERNKVKTFTIAQVAAKDFKYDQDDDDDNEKHVMRRRKKKTKD
jgi:hypothetical protein